MVLPKICWIAENGCQSSKPSEGIRILRNCAQNALFYDVVSTNGQFYRRTMGADTLVGQWFMLDVSSSSPVEAEGIAAGAESTSGLERISTDISATGSEWTVFSGTEMFF